MSELKPYDAISNLRQIADGQSLSPAEIMAIASRAAHVLQVITDEMMKLAEETGNPGDPFAIWETIRNSPAPADAVAVFPIMDGPDIPYWLAENAAPQLYTNHGQSVKRLKERCGLTMAEMWDALHGQRFKTRSISEKDFVAGVERCIRLAVPRPAPAEAVVAGRPDNDERFAELVRLDNEVKELREALGESTECLSDIAEGKGGWAIEEVIESNRAALEEE